MMKFPILFVFSFILSSSYAAVQDFCVADYTAPQGPAGYSCKNPENVTVDDFVYSALGVPDYTAPQGPAGYSCKIPANVTVDDFVYTGLEVAGNTSNINNLGITTALVAQFPGVQLLENALFQSDFPTELIAQTTLLDIAQIKKLKGLLGGCFA
ncbi:hypothetical protein M0R45_003669 [Rubus argutus]|uniref:Uncharacterized protein n=1 Tax=Rubus argutus TaxID=59490 RepID=A0AAW1YHS9_RUBAR